MKAYLPMLLELLEILYQIKPILDAWNTWRPFSTIAVIMCMLEKCNV